MAKVFSTPIQRRISKWIIVLVSIINEATFDIGYKLSLSMMLCLNTKKMNRKENVGKEIKEMNERNRSGFVSLSVWPSIYIHCAYASSRKRFVFLCIYYWRAANCSYRSFEALRLARAQSNILHKSIIHINVQRSRRIILVASLLFVSFFLRILRACMRYFYTSVITLSHSAIVIGPVDHTTHMETHRKSSRETSPLYSLSRSLDRSA